MTLKKHVKPPELDQQVPQGTQTLSASDIQKIVENFGGDNITYPPEQQEEQSTMVDLANAVAEQLKQQKQDKDNTMTSVAPEEYKGPHPGVHVTPSSDRKAYEGSGPLSHREREDLVIRLKTRTATSEDMSRIDESMIFDLPFIKAADFSIPGQYDPKPIDLMIRFRWVNCVNALQSNMQRFLALGFVLATPEDVDQVKTPLADTMIQGTQIRQYDVVLMKIPLLQLMSLYKRNMESSAQKLDMIRDGSLAAAQQTFVDLVGQDPMARSGLNKTRIASGREPVTFSHT